MTSGIQIFSYFHIIVVNYRLFVERVQVLVTVKISGGMNDFALWKGHLSESCLPGK